MIKRKDFNKGATAIDKAGHEGREARGGWSILSTTGVQNHLRQENSSRREENGRGQKRGKV